MEIDLRSVPTRYITIPRYRNRDISTRNMLDYLGFSSVQKIDGADQSEPGIDPIAESHLRALESLPNGLGLVLEDDCVIRHFRPVISVPDDADLVFLGIDSGAVRAEHWQSMPKAVKVSDNVWRVYSMVSIHAVLYVSDHGRKTFMSAFESAKAFGGAADIPTSLALPFTRTYALNVPMWYHRDCEYETNITMEEVVLAPDGSSGGYGQDFPEPITYWP